MKEYNILLVDDEEIVLKTVGANLRDRGYNVTLAKSGEEAVKLLHKEKRKKQKNTKSAIQEMQPMQIIFDVVIADLVMKGMGGLDVLKEVKGINTETMVIIHTGYGDLSSAIEAIRLHADDYILKPCETEELLYRVRRCIKVLELHGKVKFYEQLLQVCCVCNKIYDEEDKKSKTGNWITMGTYI